MTNRDTLANSEGSHGAVPLPERQSFLKKVLDFVAPSGVLVLGVGGNGLDASLAVLPHERFGQPLSVWWVDPLLAHTEDLAGIDPAAHDEFINALAARAEGRLDSIAAKIASFGLMDSSTVLQAPANVALFSFVQRGQLFDLVIMNSDFDSESVFRTLLQVWPLVQEGGMVVGVGYDDPSRPGVRPAVDQFAQNLGIPIANNIAARMFALEKSSSGDRFIRSVVGEPQPDAQDVAEPEEVRAPIDNGAQLFYEAGDPYTWTPDLFAWVCWRFGITSVLDVGCGPAVNLQWFAINGLRVLGVDGSPEAIKLSRLPDHVVYWDFMQGPWAPAEEFDLCLTTEFVEHVEAEYEQNWLAAVKKCKHVMMTHAYPGQGGYKHVNEQTSEYWIERLTSAGFSFDAETTAYLRSTASYSPGPYGRQTLLFFRRID